MSNILEKRSVPGNPSGFFLFFLSKILLHFFYQILFQYLFNFCLKMKEKCFYTKIYISAVDMMFFYRNQMLKSEKY